METYGTTITRKYIFIFHISICIYIYIYPYIYVHFADIIYTNISFKFHLQVFIFDFTQITQMLKGACYSAIPISAGARRSCDTKFPRGSLWISGFPLQ